MVEDCWRNKYQLTLGWDSENGIVPTLMVSLMSDVHRYCIWMPLKQPWLQVLVVRGPSESWVGWLPSLLLHLSSVSANFWWLDAKVKLDNSASTVSDMHSLQRERHQISPAQHFPGHTNLENQYLCGSCITLCFLSIFAQYSRSRGSPWWQFPWISFALSQNIYGDSTLNIKWNLSISSGLNSLCSAFRLSDWSLISD
jgi:hypothetical protein